MTTTSFPFKVLFCFENASKLIVEIKRTDIQSEDKSVIYQWICIQNESGNEDRISVLTFQSMSQSHDEQIREFEEGTLTWDAAGAHFNEEPMRQIKSNDIPYRSLELISNFLGTS